MAVGEEGRLMHEAGTVSEMLTSDSSKNKWNFYLLDIFLALMLICILKQKPLFGLQVGAEKPIKSFVEFVALNEQMIHKAHNCLVNHPKPTQKCYIAIK